MPPVYYSQQQQQQSLVGESMTRKKKTPIFLGHSMDDDVVPIKNGRDLGDLLVQQQSQRFQVEQREYEDGGHWINEPRGVDDIVRFMNKCMAGGEGSEA